MGRSSGIPFEERPSSTLTRSSWKENKQAYEEDETKPTLHIQPLPGFSPINPHPHHRIVDDVTRTETYVNHQNPSNPPEVVFKPAAAGNERDKKRKLHETAKMWMVQLDEEGPNLKLLYDLFHTLDASQMESFVEKLAPLVRQKKVREEFCSQFISVNDCL